ncbi:DUF2336 domain-containing protein [Agrobacterium vitis]|uniref:DUF2336 domain-containing protein n=1 Tax=Agrobacterium vitis TaxID=373 RepID=A0AAE4WCT3_AGRVI|nr:DUF2336 domain-containing protein [Agrobacterium vitis]MCF1496774.1 DUF2336 domain-containing protein [Allorhizobium sp. Av2]MUZ57253.1 DUF2336 domain-containing protein [Agrobacterium vitis]MVA65562.1 DUF2336 domain-containing protein [Agrobacterium vitis]MVA86587.1 DUF2336 domain-containing protein [Agrobacterium vitis]
MGLSVLVKAFFRWSETAKACDRAKAANALGRAYLHSPMTEDDRRSTYVAMTYLLDDPSPKVRLALAEALACSAEAPRAILISLCEDQPEIASRVILCSPVLQDRDLVDLAGRGSGMTRAFIAARPQLSSAVAAALSEIGDLPECLVLLDNPTAAISPFSLLRLAERHGTHDAVRGVLLERLDLPGRARHLLVSQASQALAASGLLRFSLGESKLTRLNREIGVSAAAVIAGEVSFDEIPDLVEQMRINGQLTPALLIELLCRGKVDFFASAIESLSGLQERRVRSILATGRMHAVRALLLSAGLDHTIAPLFVEAVLLWRHAVQTATHGEIGSICQPLLAKGSKLASSEAARQLLDLVETMLHQDERRQARQYAAHLVVDAA